MKNLQILILAVLSASLLGCSSIPSSQTQMKDNHFRFENFKRDKSTDLEYVYLMCANKKPTLWAEPKQYPGGEHNLWVKASFSKRGIRSSRKQGFVNFQLTLAPNKSYMLNRKVEGDMASIWIQDADSGQRVSEVVTTELALTMVEDDLLKLQRCKSGSV